MKKYLLTILLCTVTFFSFSQSSNWKLIDVEKTNFSNTSLKLRKTVPTSFKIYELDTKKLKKELSFAKVNELILIELPTPDGVQKFSIKKASSLSEELTLKFPMIASYVAKGVDNTSAVARISVGTDGFHCVIFYANKPSFYIDPYTKNNEYYIAYSRSSLPQRDQEFRCGVNTQLKRNEVIENTQKNANDGLLRTFRLALVCSGEYAVFHLNDQGVANNASDNIKKAAVLSAMNTSMTRINGVFERDLGVRMEIVGNNDQIIFLDAATDGITDGNAGTMINQVQTICDSTIGSANYDIGHIFSIGGSGLAGLGVVCINGSKARGVTGIATPTGDPYDIDYVSHEMGHQFGANHTQNNGCNRNNSTAVEPGSASTIMGYAGICAPNVQNNSDDHFHSVSITEMWNKIQSTANCAQTTPTGNSAPIINEGQDYTIPKSTPFVLKGNASDGNENDVLSYNWEQIDNQVVTMPPVSTSTSGPAFRSNPSISSPNRYMPALPTVIAGSISSTWEVVPTVAREMNFSLVVRDNVAGGANSARDDIKVTTQDITPFTVDGPSTNVDWPVGSSQTINWVVGATNQAPVNSQSINILLSTDGGISFPITLASGTANDGAHTIIVPNNITTQARILVEAADNIFYNVNSTNFTISASDPTFIVTDTTGVIELCSNNITSATYNISVDFLNNFSETVSFSTTGEPIGSSVSFSPTTINSSGAVTMTVSNLNSVVPDSYLIDITAFSSSITRNINVTLNILNATFEPLNLTSPNNNDTGISLTPSFSWDAISNASSYDIEIATDLEFNSIIATQNITTNSYTAASLNQSTTYYWRVKAKNSCGEGDFSSVSSFTTQTCSRCASEGTTQYNTSTTRVIFNTIDNATGKPAGYSDYTNISTAINRNTTYDLTVQVNTDGPYTTGTMVWIDWNQNCDFDDTGEEYNLGVTNNQNDGLTSQSPISILIPFDASIGQTTMRVSTEFGAYPSSCLQNFDGEVEDYTLNVIDSSLACNGLSTTWNGSSWSNGIPDADTFVIIDGTYNTGAADTGSFDACALQVDAALTVAGDTYINIDGDITINATGSLTVAHTGSVVQVQDAAVVTNNGAISVLVDTPTLDILDFMVMGSPMSAETRESVWASAWNVQDHTTANFNSIAGVTGFNFLDAELDDWNLYVTGTLNAGEGFLVRPQASLNGAGGVFNYDFNTGTLNTGVVTQTLGFNVTELESPNMLSNPYASAIDADAFLTANPEINGLYLWEHNLAPSTIYPGASTEGNNYSMDDVSFYNALGGVAATSDVAGTNTPNGVLSTGQGFGVFATAAGTATFNNAMRLTSGNTTLRNSPVAKDRLWLQVTSTMYNASGNTLVGFLEDATAGIDTNYDNGRIASVVSLYSHIEGSDRGYSVQGREAFDNGMTVALGFSSIIEEVTSYKISLSDFDGEAWLDATPYLIDNLTGFVTNLMEDTYNFTSDKGEYNDRFTLVFENRSLANQDALASSIAMYPNPANELVTIASASAAISSVEVRDIRGRLILSKSVTSQNVTTINVASLGSALYLVTITTDRGSITNRLIVK